MRSSFTPFFLAQKPTLVLTDERAGRAVVLERGLQVAGIAVVIGITRAAACHPPPGRCSSACTSPPTNQDGYSQAGSIDDGRARGTGVMGGSQ
jgi:hypothetical protein